MYVEVRTNEYSFLGRPEKALDPLESGLQVVVNYRAWVLGTDLGPLQEQYALLLNHWATAPALLAGSFEGNFRGKFKGSF